MMKTNWHHDAAQKRGESIPSFEAHAVYVKLDPETLRPDIKACVCGHDSGVMITPDMVHGMTYGGIAHGIGAALYEKFSCSEDGQLLSSTFMYYSLPSAMEIPAIRIIDHCTPSPLTTFSPKKAQAKRVIWAPRRVSPMPSTMRWRRMRSGARCGRLRKAGHELGDSSLPRHSGVRHRASRHSCHYPSGPATAS